MSVAETILRKLLDNIIEKLHYKHAEVSLKELTSGGANYTSALFSATISSQDQENLKLFAKVANMSGMLREVMNLNVLFKTEQFVYSDLVKVYDRIQDRHNISPEQRFVFPKFFGGNSTEGEETVVMEDLTAQDYGTYSRFKPLDWKHAASAVECLARFHALSFAYRKEYPEKFAEDAEKLKHKIKKQVDEPSMIETWKKMISSAISVVKEEHRQKLTDFIGGLECRDRFHDFKFPLSTPVFCHGDYRVSNLLFRETNNRLNPIVVDYQTVHTGCPTVDLLYLEFMGTDQEFRRENHERLVDHYFMELAAALDRLGLDVNEVYPRETYDEELKAMMGPALRVTLVVLPLVLVEAGQAPNMGDAQEIKEFAISPSELFAERFSGIVSDCVRWGAI